VTVGLSLIVRDEEDSLPELLKSVEGAFDQIVLCDTGSKDWTVEVFQEWAGAQEGLEWTVSRYAWSDDFAAARNLADSHLTTDWKVWADADDTIQGAKNFRVLAESADPRAVGFIVGYDYARTPEGHCACFLKRERLVRNIPGVRWEGRVHEAQTMPGPVIEVPPEQILYVHRKEADGPDSNTRNLRILRKWIKEEPKNFRVLSYLGTEELSRGRTKAALSWFRKALKVGSGWDQEYAQLHRKTALAFIAQERYDDAEKLALAQMAYLPSWPDAALTMAELSFHRREWAKCMDWCKDVLRREVPQTMLIVNPLDYEWQPKRLMAGSLFELGQYDAAVQLGKEALGMNHDPQLARGMNHWQSITKREHTAQTYEMAAQQLVNHDEQLKALKVLECLPHFAYDHPKIVAMRSFLRERIAQVTEDGFYEEGGFRPEIDAVDDQHMEAVAQSMPRSHFLLEGIKEQMA
jgi:glycosyltransferase involved in cell wall biosynthesis